jgi:hypothetical protein
MAGEDTAIAADTDTAAAVTAMAAVDMATVDAATRVARRVDMLAAVQHAAIPVAA